MARKKYNGIYYDDQANYQQMINDTQDNQKKAVYERKRNAKIGGEGLGYGTTDLYSQYLPTDTTPYDIDTDYSILTNQLLNGGNYAGAYAANAARNSKIDNEALPYAKNTLLDVLNPNFQSSVPNYQFTPYDLSQNADYQNWNAALNDQWNTLTNSKTYNSEQDQELQSLYGSILKELQDYKNSEFSYDLQGDPLYQQYADQYTTLGKEAMTDTMAQNAALTGGYGSSYSQGAGQQAFEHYLSRLNDVIPELYSQAYSQWADARAREFQVISTLLGYGDTMYGQHKTDVDDALNLNKYLAEFASGQRDSALANDYNIWQANQNFGMQANQDAWERDVYANETAYERAVQGYENAYNRQNDARSFALGWIEQTGQLPPESFLTAAGLSVGDAQSYLDGLMMQAELASGGSGGSGGGRSRGSGRSYGGSGGYSYTPGSASGSSEEYVTGGFDSNGYKSVSSSGKNDVTAGFQKSLENRNQLWWNELAANASSGMSKSQMRNKVFQWQGLGLTASEAARMIAKYHLDEDDTPTKDVYLKNGNKLTKRTK